MAERKTLLIFAKAPLLGGAKTRLAADIGAPAAQRVYAEITRDVVRRLADAPAWSTWLSVSPDTFANRGRLWPDTVPRLPQGQGDLGQRMTAAMLRFAVGPVVIVGSDIPGIQRHHVRQAFKRLAVDDFVFGPATDGGYWLVGVRRSSLAQGLFRGVAWSSPTALADTLANVDARRRVSMLETIEDIDDGAALERWLRPSAPSRAR